MILSDKRAREILDKFPHLPPVLVLGDVGLDKYTYGEVSRISPEAPVAILEVTREWHKLGLAANVNDNLKELNVNSTLCAVIGQDSSGDKLTKIMNERGISIDGLLIDTLRSTTLKERVTTKTQQICRIDYESKQNISADMTTRLIQLGSELISNHSGLIIEDYGKGLITEKVAVNFISLFKEAGKLVAIDPSRSTPPEYYRGATLLKPNLEEAKILVSSLGYKELRLEKIAEILSSKLQIEKIVITLGAQGMGLFDRNKSTFNIIPTVAKEVFDVSGAGDTAISVLTSALLGGASLIEAAWLANCAAGVVVAKRGTATVSLTELNKFHLDSSSEISQRFPTVSA